ncbi:MAG TPA: CHASE3 domain-containing protein [Verrucomicrobiae bacterium]|nr:CHASE3 domain-containing protein [Verrucomicrobiae bacterium]
MTEGKFKLVRWAPVGLSIVLMGFVAAIATRTVSELKEATYWRERTFQAVLDAQTIEDKLVDAQTSVRDYAEKGAPELLIEYRSDTNTDLQEIKRLEDLTRGDPDQQRRLKELAAAMKEVFDFDDKVIGVFARQGAAAATSLDEGSEGRKVTSHALKELQDFSEKEKRLLSERDEREQADYRHAAHLLVVASVAVAVLLILANWFASREMARRRRAEAGQLEMIASLQKALAEVKTLSGLIPICGWCKSVRSDTGYWQSVEHYVRARTDANFTHGICPACQAKFNAEVQKAAAGTGQKVGSQNG